MNNKIVIAGCFLLALSVFFSSLTISLDPPTPTYELAEDHNDVATTNGEIDLPEGIEVGGNFPNHINLTETTTLNVVGEGELIFGVGTSINCDPLPHHPDPCGGS